MPAALAGLAHNKPVLLGAGAAAALGLYAHSKSKASGSASTAAAAGSTNAAGDPSLSGGALGTYPNSAPTDIATALGNIDSQYADQVKGFTGQLGTDEAALKALQAQDTGLAAAVAGLTPKPSSAAAKSYTVKKGDTQAKIAARYHTSVHALQALNPAIQSKGSKVHVGEKLKLPA